MGEIKEYLKKYFMTGDEFQEHILEMIGSLENDRTFAIKLVDKEQNEYSFGKESLEGRGSSKEIDLEDGYKFFVQTWGNNHDEWVAELTDLFSLYINKEYCDRVTGLPATDREQLIRKCDDTLHLWLKRSGKVAIFVIDLDHFKDVNSKYGSDAGTAVLSEFSRLLFRVTNRKAILVHQNGDEFDIIYPYKKAYEVISFAAQLYKGVKGHVFKNAADIKLTMAMGICLTEEGMGFRKAREEAENAYAPKTGNVEKHRDSIRVHKNGKRVLYGCQSLELAIVRVWNSQDDQLFHNPYLDYLVKLSEGSELNEIQQNVEGFLKWVMPALANSNMRCTAIESSWDTEAEFSEAELGLAVLRGVLNKPEIYDKKISFSMNEKVEVSVDKNIVFSYGEKLEGKFHWEGFRDKDSIEKSDIRKTILIQAGSKSANLPMDIFYRVVKVDTWPTSSGSLPDFWEGTISELISLMKKQPNLVNILIWGDVDNTREVLYYLKNIDKWGSDSQEQDLQYRYIARKTFWTVEDIMLFHEKFSGHVVCCNSEEDIIFHTYKALLEKAKPMSFVAETVPCTRFLERSLSYTKIQLSITDGCRAESIAEAFPTVLEILRNAYRENPERKMLDQNGEELFELTNFKIVLEKPTYNKLPIYYYYDQEKLNRYYDKTFGAGKGLFRKPLEESRQIDGMIQHILEAIDTKKQYETRRAILVVPNVIEKEKVYSPLGLVAVWVTPRVLAGKINIDYSFTWRTVEAITGLPSSMYASVTFAEEITQMIKENAKNTDISEVVNLGHVSYIAHSLHMFLGEERMNIVRGIVDEVSV